MKYSTLIDIINDKSDVKVRPNDKGIGMIDHKNPVSITEAEFNFIQNIIITHNLTRGYECATAFGISALAAGLGFKETNGQLVTMDAYIEELYNDCSSYFNMEGTFQDSDGYKLANFLIKEYQVPVVAEIGWSPDDVTKVINRHYNGQKLDYVFIDAMHNDNAFIKDVKSVLPHLLDEFIFLGHDLHCFAEKTAQWLSDTLNGEIELAITNDDPNYNLFMVKGKKI